jgi:hypothetical protein
VFDDCAISPIHLHIMPQSPLKQATYAIQWRSERLTVAL